MAISNPQAGRAFGASAVIPHWGRYLFLPVVCLLPLLLTAPFFLEPFERDEGVYATIAQRLLDGELPYRDYFDHKPPLIYVWYVLSFTLFGETIVAPRLMAALVWSMTALVVYKQGALLLSEAAGRAAALIFALSSAIVLLQANANTETFMILPLAGSLYSFTQGLKTRRLEWFALAGLCGGLAVLTKQVAGVNLAAGALFIAAYTAKDVGARQVIRQFAALCAVFALVIGVALVPYVLSGSIGDFFYANWTYNRLYAAEIPTGERIDAEFRGVRLLFVSAGPLLILGLLGVIAALRGGVRSQALLAIWLVASFCGIVLSGRAFPHYYVTLLPSLSLLAAIAVCQYSRYRPRTRLYLTIIVALAALLSIGQNGQLYSQPTAEAKHSLRFGGVNPEPQNLSPELAAYIRSATSTGDVIYNYGRETQLYFYADRQPASRFIYDRPFWLDPPTFDEAMIELRSAKPVLIVDSVSARNSPNWEATHPAELQALLEESYEFIGRYEFADLYRLR